MNTHSTTDYEVALHEDVINEAALHRLADLLQLFAGDLVKEMLLSETTED